MDLIFLSVYDIELRYVRCFSFIGIYVYIWSLELDTIDIKIDAIQFAAPEDDIQLMSKRRVIKITKRWRYSSDSYTF